MMNASLIEQVASKHSNEIFHHKF